MRAAIAFFLIVTVAAEWDAPPSKALLDAAWTALNSDPELTDLHRGYLTYLDTHPEIASAEGAYRDLTTTGALGRLVKEFDEALAREPAMQELFDRYLGTIAKDDGLRRSVDDLYRLVLEDNRLREGLSAAVTYLLAHPDEAVGFLQKHSRLRSTPEEIYPLVGYFKTHPDARKALLQCFEEIHGFAAAHAHVFPWWRAVAEPGSETGESYRRLLGNLADCPRGFWVWRRRAIALASDPKARDWIRYWERRVRRDPVLSDVYPEYLRILRERPGYKKAAFGAWELDLGQAPPWPPEGKPPELSPLRKGQAEKPKRPTKQDLMPEYPGRPVKPGKPAIEAPVMPERPARPAKPPKPDKKETNR